MRSNNNDVIRDGGFAGGWGAWSPYNSPDTNKKSTADDALVGNLGGRVMTLAEGTLAGSASYDTTNYWVLLTPNTTNTYGALYWSINPGPNVDVDFQFVGGGGADATYFFVYCTSIPTSEDAAAGGYLIAYDEYPGPGAAQVQRDAADLLFRKPGLLGMAEGEG
jgi:hypothetical protein